MTAALSVPGRPVLAACQAAGCRELVVMSTLLELPDGERLEVDLCPYHHDQVAEVIDAAVEDWLAWE